MTGNTEKYSESPELNSHNLVRLVWSTTFDPGLKLPFCWGSHYSVTFKSRLAFRPQFFFRFPSNAQFFFQLPLRTPSNWFVIIWSTTHFSRQYFAPTKIWRQTKSMKLTFFEVQLVRQLVEVFHCHIATRSRAGSRCIFILIDMAAFVRKIT